MNRQALKLPFSVSRTPDWQCPTCGTGILKIRADTFRKDERRHSRDHSQDAWDPDWIQYIYSCLLTCTNEDCGETVCSAGIGSVDSCVFEDANGEIEQNYDDFFRPKFFEPHLELIPIPEKCPKSVCEPLRESFKLFFLSPSAASNSVRISIEELLTNLKIKRYNIIKGKRRLISLHQRIGLIPAKHDALKDMFLAIKWLGNAGSHGAGAGSGEITIDDVMDSYELMEHILQEIYEPKTKKLMAIAKKVNKKKGPAKP